ncbi:MAG: hypothetical protein B9S32_11175 [Verrucomicrobia bacterium Tous-C9LFEB]|nr:MAG: hypothetical protein B9S32_11175 [Verrucomicrobia bacterium Tous-C9LFEB]
MAARSLPPRWIHFWALLTLLATLGLLGMGGLVTSHGAGLAVPDWPNTFGYNMFLFPISKWVGGIFYEHLHRLWASGVGMLTIVLAVGLAWQEPRAWMRRLGWTALVLVILQGVLGGLRVTLLKNEIGIVHACLAQAFFVLIGFLALATSRWWGETAETISPRSVPVKWRWLVIVITAVVYLQLALGARMRHAHLGLSIPDYPLAYGQVIPPFDAASVEQINEMRYQKGLPSTTTEQIVVQFTHRTLAIVIFFAIMVCAEQARCPQTPRVLRRMVMFWAGLVALQFVLGAATVWSDKAADVATAHVVVGALTLLTGAMLGAMTWRIQSNPDRVDDNRGISNTMVA